MTLEHCCTDAIYGVPTTNRGLHDKAYDLPITYHFFPCLYSSGESSAFTIVMRPSSSGETSPRPVR